MFFVVQNLTRNIKTKEWIIDISFKEINIGINIGCDLAFAKA
ncbi:hypothetical protein DDD_0624 [Nonlabens dokdonensis DSW-6]|uniref:Uncharacterized protein n=1 Tax=Nonlabens dokdonensis (strain DSM 17205 / KCTC 12402 / DSW-6) TaxID=592029 RepID=L7W7J6_NONDD|nr:hypothetical protein DDD_0624 [Nonlabens dokdonensis DSW-6]